jgi:hypothetical protein
MSDRAQQSTLLRIKFLENDTLNFKADLEKLTEANEITLIQGKVHDTEIRIDENKQWLRVLEGDPNWGELVETDGDYLPKMPTFKNDRDLKHALEHPENWYREDQGEDEQHFMATREMVHRHHNELALTRMDGEGVIAEEERQELICGAESLEESEPSGPQNEES